MPWSETSTMEQKRLFIQDYVRGSFEMAELCRRYGISRPTGYKWIDRFETEGLSGLEERSRRPDGCSHETAIEITEAILELRRKHPYWGAKKLLRILRNRHPKVDWPARSTVCDLLSRHGMIDQKRRRPYPGHPGKPPQSMDAPNDTWCVDYKGEFKTGDGIYCYPLTITDGCTRFIVRCHGLPSTAHKGAKPVFRDAFKQFGLPKIIRSDNGVPFATTAIGRLSRLSVWWIRLGIYPDLIEPGKPQQNGRHERMHKTLKQETTRPPAKTMRGQQRRFDRFIKEFNQERPHEALGQRPPAAIYTPSSTPLGNLPDPDYPLHDLVVTVAKAGTIWPPGRVLGRRFFYVSTALVGHPLGLRELDDGRRWRVSFMNLQLGHLDPLVGFDPA